MYDSVTVLGCSSQSRLQNNNMNCKHRERACQEKRFPNYNQDLTSFLKPKSGRKKNQNHNSRANRQYETESITALITAFSRNINSTLPAASNLFFIDELKAWKTFRGKSSVDCLLHNACQTACSSGALFLMHFNEEHISSAPNLSLSVVPPPLQDAAWRKSLYASQPSSAADYRPFDSSLDGFHAPFRRFVGLNLHRGAH